MGLQNGAGCGMMFSSEQVLGTHEVADLTGVFFMPADNCIPVRRKVRRSSIMLRGFTPVSASWVPSLDERRTLRVQKQEMHPYA